MTTSTPAIVPFARQARSPFILWIVTATTYAFLVSLLWLPFGLNITDFSDAWVIYHEIERGAPFVSLLDSRPFHLVAFHIGHALTPDSFVGANLLIIALLWAKAILVYALLRRLVPRLPLVAFFAGALFIVFPADTGVFWLGAINIHLNTLYCLLSAVLLIWFFEKPSIPKLIAVWCSVVLSFTYEANYLLIAIMPAMLLWLERRFSRKVVLVSLAWYLAVAVMAVRLVLLYTQGDAAFAYQQSLTAVGLGTADPLREMLNSVVRVTERNLGFIWTEAVETLRSNFQLSYGVIAAVGGLPVMIGGWLHTLHNDRRLDYKDILFLIALSILVITLGFAPYLPTQLRDMNYRTQYLAQVGGALFTVTVIAFIPYVSKFIRRLLFILAISALFALSTRLIILVAVAGGLALAVLPRRVIYVSAATALVIIGTYSLIVRHEQWAQMPLRQQWIMEAMTRQAPALSADAFVVLLDETPDLRGLQAFESRRDVIVGALGMLYENPIQQAAFCAPFEAMWGFFREQCTFRDDGLWVSWSRGETVIPYGKLVLFQYSDSLGAELMEQLPNYAPVSAADLYDPYALIDATAPPPRRVLTLYQAAPFTEQPPFIPLEKIR